MNRLARQFGLGIVGSFMLMPAWAQDLQTVLLVSIDALHPAALQADGAPNLESLKRRGQFTLEGRSVNPPQTLIAHTAMLTGLSPEQGGKQDNNWQPGEPRVAHETLLDFAKKQGFETGYFYAKPKLGYLITPSISSHALARDDGVERAQAFLREPGQRFVFLHLSGLDEAGPDSGWLSKDYLDELRYIDRSLAPLLTDVRQRGTYLIVVTSDHAGHERLHGTSHPEDFKLPLLVQASWPLPGIVQDQFSIVRVRPMVQNAMAQLNGETKN